MHYVYMLQCADGSLYTGYTNDLSKRIITHNQGKGAKYTATRRPVELLYHESYDTKEKAMQREYQIKKLSRKTKEQLLSFDVAYFLPDHINDTKKIERLPLLSHYQLQRLSWDIVLLFQNVNNRQTCLLQQFIIDKEMYFLKDITILLQAERNNMQQKLNLLQGIISGLSDSSLQTLRPALLRIRDFPTECETACSLHHIAANLLEKK